MSTMLKADNNELAAFIAKYQYNFDKGIKVFKLKVNLHQKYKRKLWEDKFICLLGTKVPMEFIVELKHYEHELDEAFTDFTAENTDVLLNIVVRKFLEDTPIPVCFLKISALVG